MEHFEDFAPGGKGTAIIAFVLIDGLHEGDFFIRIIALARRRIDLTAPLPLMPSVVSFAAFYIDRNILLTPVSAATVATSSVGN
jgi:hypothetical protein